MLACCFVCHTCFFSWFTLLQVVGEEGFLECRCTSLHGKKKKKKRDFSEAQDVNTTVSLSLVLMQYCFFTASVDSSNVHLPTFSRKKREKKTLHICGISLMNSFCFEELKRTNTTTTTGETHDEFIYYWLVCASSFH